MACTTCSGGCSTTTSSSGEKTGGCNGGCATGGCNKMNSYDWLSDMQVPVADKYPFVELRFKGGRKEFYVNTLKLELYTGDAVTVEYPGGGYHVGFVSMQGELVRLQMMRKKIKDTDPEIKSILRKSSDKDLEKLAEARNRELPALFRSRQIIDELKLVMKLSDVEFQSDLTKACFYYSAEDRVDFRELIKQLAGEFKLRIDMRQISLRQEAGRLGGIGSCGRELCCSTWLPDFKSVTTSAARYQNLSLNPAKLSGNCGRLKCCLNYELENYIQALKTIPNIDKPLDTEKGYAFLQKTDIFRRIMWFGYKGVNEWIALPIERVEVLVAQNKEGIKIAALTEEEEVALVEESENPQKINDDLSKLDKKYAQKDKDFRKSKIESRPKTGAVLQQNSEVRGAARTEQKFAKPENRLGKQESQTARPEQRPARPRPQEQPLKASQTPEKSVDSLKSDHVESPKLPITGEGRTARQERFERQRAAQAAENSTNSASKEEPQITITRTPFERKDFNKPRPKDQNRQNFKKREGNSDSAPKTEDETK